MIKGGKLTGPEGTALGYPSLGPQGNDGAEFITLIDLILCIEFFFLSNIFFPKASQSFIVFFNIKQLCVMTDPTPRGPAYAQPRGINQGPGNTRHPNFPFSNHRPHGDIPKGPRRLPPADSGYGLGRLEDDSGFILAPNLENTNRDPCFQISFKRLASKTSEHKNLFIIHTYNYNDENHQIFSNEFQRIVDVHTIMLDTSHANRWKVNFLAQDTSISIVNYAAGEISDKHKRDFANWILSTGLTLCRDEVQL